MESVHGVNVPMYTTLRRTTVVFTMIMEYFLAKQKHTPPIIGSVALIVFGVFVAGARDLSFDARGYAIVFVDNITTAVYLATINHIGKSSGLNSFGLMWCNGLVCGPSVLLTYIQGDLKRTMEFPYLNPGFMLRRDNLQACMLYVHNLTHLYRLRPAYVVQPTKLPAQTKSKPAKRKLFDDHISEHQEEG